MKQNVLDNFSIWMSDYGRISRKTGEPVGGLSPFGSIHERMIKMRRLLIELGYIEVYGEDGNLIPADLWLSDTHTARSVKCRPHTYKWVKEWRDLSEKELEELLRPKLRNLVTPQDKTRMADYVKAATKFAEYLHYEAKYRNKPVWSRAQLDRFKARVKKPDVEYLAEDVEVPDPVKFDKYLEFLRTKNYKKWFFIFFGRWIGARKLELIHAKKTLDRHAIKVIWKTRRITIWGKGRGGLSKPRHPTLFPQVETELKKFLQWREDQEANDGYLFVNRWGNKYADKTKHLNDFLQDHALEFNRKFPDYAFDDREMSLLTTHRCMRHMYVTTLVLGGLNDDVIKKMTGIEDDEVLDRYKNLRFDQASRLAFKAVQSYAEEFGGGNEGLLTGLSEEKTAALEKLAALPQEKLEALLQLVG